MFKSLLQTSYKAVCLHVIRTHGMSYSILPRRIVSKSLLKWFPQTISTSHSVLYLCWAWGETPVTVFQVLCYLVCVLLCYSNWKTILSLVTLALFWQLESKLCDKIIALLWLIAMSFGPLVGKPQSVMG